jgi:myo-inositol 2-dehydrogenase / D-chiro-inositol 1-dehydrogenase
MSTTRELRVGVVGAGMMGADHVARITDRITGATVSAIIEPDEQRAAAAIQASRGAQSFSRIEDALDAGAVDAVLIAVPGQFHEPVLLTTLEAGLPILCEKPLTADPESSWRILEAEQKRQHPLIQVGFMRRFDAEYRQLRELVAGGTAGRLLLLRCVHRNPAVPDSYTQEMLITDSVVHELDIAPWLADAAITSIEIRRGRRNSLSPAHLNEPLLVLIELDDGVLVDVEMNISVQFGYQVATEAVFEAGLARIGQPAGLQLWQDGRFQIAEQQSFRTRFQQAFDTEIQAWIGAARHATIAGPSAWDGYKVAVACAAGVQALSTPGAVPVELPEKPDFYAGA